MVDSGSIRQWHGYSNEQHRGPGVAKIDYELAMFEPSRKRILPVLMPAESSCDFVALDLARVLLAEHHNELSENPQERVSRDDFYAEPFSDGVSRIVFAGTVVASVTRLKRERKTKANR